MSIIAFAVVFILTILLQQWLHRHIQGLVLALTGNPGCGVRLLFYLLLPGVLLHEGSHYVFAKALFVRTKGFNIGIGKESGQRVSLGSVNIARTDPIRESLIGVAPFVVGLGAIAAIAGWGFAIWPNAGLTPQQMFQQVAAYTNDWTTWLDLYLVFAVSTAMIPSESDREPWGPVITVIGMVVAVLLLLGWTPRVPPDTVILARQLLDGLTLALGIAVVVNGFIGVLVWLGEFAVAHVSGKWVAYRARRKY